VVLTFAVLVPVSALTLYWFTQRAPVASKDGAPMVLIPAGAFRMGDDESSPLHDVYVSAFYLDQFEITTARYARFLATTGSLTPPDDWDELDLKADGTLPVVGVAWHDADAYCRWVGKRLPTEAEWEKAARDGDARTYPWGNAEPTSALAAYSRTAELPYQGGVSPVGAHAAGQSHDGVQDLAGNVSEWVGDWYSESIDRDDIRDPAGPPDGMGKVIRGSGWQDPVERLNSARRYYASPDHRSDDLGFRCARAEKK
jgi:formylglycine-generating enzyme required for sulfatase activity